MRDAIWHFREALKFVSRDLFQDGWRTWITLLNLLVFLSCYFCLAALARAANQYGQQETQENTLLVISKNVFNPGDSRITETDFAPIRQLEPQSVAAFSPLIYKLLRIDDYLIQVCGAPVENFFPVFGLKLSSGHWPVTDDEVLISDGAALVAHWKLGQTLSIYGKSFHISGSVTTAGTQTTSVWMTLPQAEHLFNTHGVFQFAWVRVAEKADASQLKQTLQSSSLSKKFDVFFVNSLYQQYADALQDIRDISLVLVGFALALVIVGTYGSVYLTLSERSREITILRAVGFSIGSLRGILLLRSLIQVFFAYLFAWGLSAILLAHFNLISPLTINSLPLLVSIDGMIGGGGLLLSVVCGCLGVWLPTIRLRFAPINESIQR